MVDAFNLQSIVGDVKVSTLTRAVTFSFLSRLDNYDITLTPSMSTAQILAAITATGVTVDPNGYITMPANMRPLAVVGFAADLPIIGPLLGLQSPENCISGTSFSYPINGLIFPLPMAIDTDVLLYVTINGSTVVVNTDFEKSIDVDNRYIPPQTMVNSITVGFMSIYRYPLSLVNSVTVILKVN
jgi:hypothetical protein